MASKFAALLVVGTCFGVTLAQLSGSVADNPAGGKDVSVTASKFVGNPTLNIGGGVLASANTLQQVPSVGAFAALNVEEHSLGVSRTHTPGVSDAVSQTLRVNFLNNEKHRLDANLFSRHTKLNDGFKYDTRGGSLDYAHRAGHGLSAGASHIRDFGTTVDLTGKANLWSSPNRRTSFDLTGSASKTFGAPTPQKINFGGGLGFTHRF